MIKSRFNFGSRFGIAEFCLLMIFTIGVHAFVLRYIFPGYYNPLWPNHSDFYFSSALANTPSGILSVFKLPRPIGTLFIWLIGHLGIQGSIAAVIVLIQSNCVLSAMLFRRIIGIDFKWSFIAAFFVYLYLIFSQPYFYTFCTEDQMSQLSYFLLINAAWFFHIYLKRPSLYALILFFFFAILAFLAKETYALTSLVIASAWLLSYPKKNTMHALIPLVALVSALGVSFIYNACMHSRFYGFDTNAFNAPYKMILNPASVFGEWSRYAREGLNVLNLGMFLLIVLTSYRYFRADSRKIILVLLSCLIGALLAWIPNSIFPNHHFGGYSCSGSYILFLPVILIALFLQNNKQMYYMSMAVILLGISSPVLNKNEYLRNDWYLEQENIQRNLLSTLHPLLDQVGTTGASKRILVTGLSFPFNPFIHPMCLLTLTKASLPEFDVVAYSTVNFKDEALGDRVNWVKFIRPDQIDFKKYTNVWMFTSDGRLIHDLHIGNPIADQDEPLGVKPGDLIVFPDIARILWSANALVRKSIPINQEMLLFNCGLSFINYDQPELALRCFNDSIAKDPKNPFLYYYVGIAFERINLNSEAKIFFKKAVALDNLKHPNFAFIRALLWAEDHS